ncbi:PTS lactose/cellobiose transporter subunit IIA [uncultured Clostridium sp.]|uniref:PTS lactose/cellobiose transporter subunit IIA n=1 Tax=uncultured Clostridium sp. TaxID=59620 RepID=UPI00258F557E|nr:PTS lactose/cellobiose transporter subunit IIA [uncultured Clostridium sp.]
MAKVDMEAIVFELISRGGTAKGMAYEALAEAEKGNYEEAENLLRQADEELLAIHNVQTELIQSEAAGEKNEVSILFVHAQDHLMTAIEAKNLIECMIKMYKRMDGKL